MGSDTFASKFTLNSELLESISLMQNYLITVGDMTSRNKMLVILVILVTLTYKEIKVGNKNEQSANGIQVAGVKSSDVTELRNRNRNYRMSDGKNKLCLSR